MANTNPKQLDKDLTPKIGFKLGTQSALNTLLNSGTGALHGTFYLTQDTHRLYIGNHDGTLSPVNQGIITVNSLSALQSITGEAGQFYYISPSATDGYANILCVWSNGRWVQINAVNKVDEFKNTVTVSSNTATITHTITQTEDATPRTSTVTIKGQNGVTVSAAASSNNHGIIINGNKASAAAAIDSQNTSKAKVTLSNSNATDSSVIGLIAGTNMGISVSGNDITLTSTNNRISAVSVANHSTSGFNITVSDDGGLSKTGRIDPEIAYGASGDQSAKFLSGTATLAVYSKTEVDGLINERFRNFNAMTYKGALTNAEYTAANSSPGNANHQIGDTYILSESVTVGTGNNAVTYPAGTLIVAKGTEDTTTGKITTATLAWDYVDSTGADTRYTWTAISHGIKVTNNSTTGEVGKFALKAGTAITLTDTSGTATTYREVEVKHANVTNTTETLSTHTASIGSASGDDTINVITGVTVNAQGHVTKVSTTPLKISWVMPTLANDTVATDVTTSGTTHTGTVTMTHKMSYSSGGNSTATGAFSIASDTINITNSGSALTMNLLWGSF